jgi:hypothetical protein
MTTDRSRRHLTVLWAEFRRPPRQDQMPMAVFMRIDYQESEGVGQSLTRARRSAALPRVGTGSWRAGPIPQTTSRVPVGPRESVGNLGPRGPRAGLALRDGFSAGSDGDWPGAPPHVGRSTSATDTTKRAPPAPL